jgi:cell division protease FtsH
VSDQMNMNWRFAVTWLTSLVLLIALDGIMERLSQQTPAEEISFSQLLTEVDHGHVQDVVIQVRKSAAPSATVGASRPI